MKGYISDDSVLLYMFSQRNTPLIRILKIEETIKDIEFDPNFRKMKNNLRSLETASRRGREISVGSPEDMGRIIELRRNSVEIGETIATYKEKLEGYTSRLDLLKKERVELQRQLFPSSRVI